MKKNFKRVTRVCGKVAHKPHFLFRNNLPKVHGEYETLKKKKSNTLDFVNVTEDIIKHHLVLFCGGKGEEGEGRGGGNY